MNSIRTSLKRAREAHDKDPLSRQAYSYESWALGTIKGMVSIWADDTYRGEPLKGHQRNNWAKEVLNRIIELDKIFKEDRDAKK